MPRSWRFLLPLLTSKRLTQTPHSQPATPAASTTINTLPVELLHLIFSHLTFLDLVCARLTCHYWRAVSHPLFRPYIRDASQPRTAVITYPKRVPHYVIVAVPVLYFNLNVEGDLSVTGTTLSHTGHFYAAMRINPVFAMPNRDDSGDLARFNVERCRQAGWARMYVSSPPTAQVQVSLEFECSRIASDRAIDRQFRSDLYNLSRHRRVKRKMGVCVADVAEYVQRNVEGMSVDVGREGGVYKAERKREVAIEV
jgi:hypothetical protein